MVQFIWSTFRATGMNLAVVLGSVRLEYLLFVMAVAASAGGWQRVCGCTGREGNAVLLLVAAGSRQELFS